MNNCCLIILILLFCSNGNGWGSNRCCDWNRDRDRDREKDRDSSCGIQPRNTNSCGSSYSNDCPSCAMNRESRMVYPSYSGGSTCGCDDSENQG